MSRGSRLAPLLVAVVAVGCTATTPSPSVAPSAPATAGVTARPTVTPRPSARPAPTPTPIAERMRITIRQLDTELIGLVLEVASDGHSIWYSGPGPDETEVAPDLYRYTANLDETPELVWRGPDRNRSIVKIAGDLGTVAWSDLDIRPGERAWDLWLLPRDADEPIHLDTLVDDPLLAGSVPAFDVHDGRVAWTVFRGTDGEPVSELWFAREPDWEPRLLESRPAAERELWLPSLRWGTLAYAEVIYGPDRQTEERHVYVLDTDDPEAEPRRLDTSGKATMPVVVEGGVVWKETEPGMSMFNWGWLFHHTFADGRTRPLNLGVHQYNYPSAGGRFVTAWSIDSSILTVYDLERDHARTVELHPPRGPGAAVRPHLGEDLLVWTALEIDMDDLQPPVGLRYTFLPDAGGYVRLGN